MSANNQSPSGMLGTYLYNTDTLAERPAQTQNRKIRDSTRSCQSACQPMNAIEKSLSSDDALARLLDRDMKARTDPVLLRDARENQQGSSVPSLTEMPRPNRHK
ncbi:hypothetical protein EDD37DRAFT_611187 [Exophiala viscosa]|uniref:Uncharacterized protein n=1 Tax=Exophiala viscosa TaxID=2486360 RepID=A0AAN6DVY5_9EURO|nr:hypothetical protein EDD36DRAFT_417535 [Exophiala viscosa]KAI1622780.1 hypothetical protein EDD37DRAFT_611187 [Exophiala viscosa]